MWTGSAALVQVVPPLKNDVEAARSEMKELLAVAWPACIGVVAPVAAEPDGSSPGA